MNNLLNMLSQNKIRFKSRNEEKYTCLSNILHAVVTYFRSSCLMSSRIIGGLDDG